jgi:3-oxoadipate enol-lactonase
MTVNPRHCGGRVAKLQLQALTIAYDVEGEGPSLIFIHQVATDRRLWQSQRPFFAQRYRLITVDVLGHGDMAWPLAELSIDRAAMHVQALLESLQTGAVIAIGVSMGAAIAVRIALNNPALIRGLVLVSPWSQLSGDTRNLIDRLFRLAEAGDLATHHELFLRMVLSGTYLRRHPTEVEPLQALAREQNARAVAYAWAACLACDLTSKLGEITVPSLVIAGMNDLFTPPYVVRAVAEELSTVELEVWEETGHFAFLEDAARFNRRLETFIRRCLAASSGG